MADTMRSPAAVRRRSGAWIAGCLMVALAGVAAPGCRERVAGWDGAAQRADPAGFAAHLDGLLARSRESLAAARERLVAVPVPSGGRLGASETEAAAARVTALLERLDAARRELDAQRELVASRVSRQISDEVVSSARAALDEAETLIQSDILRRAVPAPGREIAGPAAPQDAPEPEAGKPEPEGGAPGQEAPGGGAEAGAP